MVMVRTFLAAAAARNWELHQMDVYTMSFFMVVFLGGSPISWKTKKQHIVSQFSLEAEYRLMAAVTSELKWLKALLLDLSVLHSRPMALFCDSQSVLHIAQNPLADIFTKALSKEKFLYLLRKLGTTFLPASS
ncbi:hypothetical protein LIER_22049 [Lithospermum erythrorhizon]|uniref:Retrovirus-related Pol polyprotein from transposon RE2 n=1 Tax=Lithospermum erythrorhizon TaxID=34254 RepID=A0AAV3QVE7_LITER